ncbi:MAG: ATP-dependent helicase [Dehalococcoidia bacterium]|nr:MAG: ATP-dependent helicase [Dehalococcoidia bacterium]
MQEPGWLDELNPRQREAVTHGDGPLLVVAGAGSGKTRTLACRVAFLMSQGVAPERILLLTFTRRAAEEMLKRAAASAAGQAQSTRRVWGGTFHAFANRVLRIYARPAGLAQEYSVIDRTDAEDFLNVVRNEMGLARKGRRFPQKATCLDIYSRRVNSTEDLREVLTRHYPWCLEWEAELASLFGSYVERKQAQNVLDYDDLLLYLYYLLEDPQAGNALGGRFDHVLVDEYQDTNRIQAGILTRLRRGNHNIMAVGDDAQSIYGFRSATVRNMLDFPTEFPGTTIVTLDQNYRSLQPILDTTNHVIAQAHERFSKDLWATRGEGQRPQLITCGDESDEDDEVIRLVLEHYEQGIPLRRQAVLFRAASNSASLELALTRKNIPFRKYGGLRFLEAAHVKDVVSLLRIVENPRDEIAWFRVLHLINGIGPVTATQAISHLAAHAFNPEAIGSFAAPAAARSDVARLSTLMTEVGHMSGNMPAALIERVAEYYAPLLQQNYENPEPRRQDIAPLAQLAAGYSSIAAFLDDLILDPPLSTADLAGPPLQDEDWLVLSTIHSAKGLEWDAVYLIHAADGCLPSDMSTGSKEEIDEELRLTYVAMTRARDFLYVLWPLRFYGRSPGVTDRHVYAQRCRFLNHDVAATMDERAVGQETDSGGLALPDDVLRDIGARIRDIWR